MPPDYIVKKLVEKRIPARQIAGAFHVRIHCDSLEHIHTGINREFVQTDVAEAVKGQMRLVSLHAVLTDIGKKRFGGSIVIGIKVAVAIQHFGMAQHDAVAGPRRQRHRHIAGYLLPEIDHRLAFWRFENGAGTQPLLFPHLFPLLLYKGIGRAVVYDRRTDFTGGMRCVIRFSVIEQALTNGTAPDRPAIIGADALARR